MCLGPDRGGDPARRFPQKVIWWPNMGRTSIAQGAFTVSHKCHPSSIYLAHLSLPHASPVSCPAYALFSPVSSTSIPPLFFLLLLPAVLAMSHGQCHGHHRCHPCRRPRLRFVSTSQSWRSYSSSTFFTPRLSGAVTTQVFMYFRIYGGDDYRRNILIVSLTSCISSSAT